MMKKSISFRFSDEEKEFIEFKSQLLGFKNTSEYVRCIVLSDFETYQKKKKQEEKETSEQLSFDEIDVQNDPDRSDEEDNKYMKLLNSYNENKKTSSEKICSHCKMKNNVSSEMKFYYCGNCGTFNKIE